MNKLLAVLIGAIIFCAPGFAQKEKLSVEELLKRHQASIGTPEAIAAARSRVFVGRGMLTSKLGYNGRLVGPAQFASDGDKLLLAIVFNNNDYQYEKLAFDGKDISFGRPDGNLTKLGEYVKSQPAIVKQGLFGGVLSASWPLLPGNQKKTKVESAGTESIGGQDLYKVRLRLSGGDARVSMYFEPETFHHVMTVYQYTIEPHLISSDSTENARAKASYFTLTEKFSNFKKVGDLVIPLGYEIDISNQLQDSTEQLSWTIAFTQAFYNEPLEAGVFKVS
jgi:hypothetical protein